MRKVEMRNDQTMIDEPKTGDSSRDATIWKPMLSTPARKTSR
jgi:hypothetical protein